MSGIDADVEMQSTQSRTRPAPDVQVFVPLRGRDKALAAQKLLLEAAEARADRFPAIGRFASRLTAVVAALGLALLMIMLAPLML